MSPPQFPSTRVKLRPGGDRPVTAGKKPSFLSPVATPTKKFARPTSTPDLSTARPRPPAKVVTVPSTPAVASLAEKMARPAPHSHILTAPSAAGTHQHSTPNLVAHSAARPRPPCTSKATAPTTPDVATPAEKASRPTAPFAASAPRPSSKTTASTTHGARRPAARPAYEFMAPRGAESVHPARRLAPGTAVYVRTRFLQLTEKCCLMIWLPARVVSSPDAYQCTVKYAADLNPMFAGKMVRMPTHNIRERAAAAAKTEPRKMATAPEAKDTSL
ncbi:uncharacterized protein LOC133913976 [Phragmites australis]|uniref:uncharacterized protein LOC133913976 n=1 Tax=Phragmites australis TaxID=29695 RepID=UPI002D78915E|nr:uncharacterized protein LOC133913976 [Phragmites australis]